MYIATTTKKYKNTSYTQLLIREGYREDGKVKNRTLLNLTNKPKHQVNAIVAALSNKNTTPINADNQKQGRLIGFSFVIMFLMKLLKITKALGQSYEARIAMVLITARIILQGSRIQALHWAKEEDKILDLLKFSPDEKARLTNKTIYKGLDYITDNQTKIENKLFKSHYKNKPPKRLFYDVTSSYVEGDYVNSELVTYGYNRDKKQGKKQIVIGLLTDENGHAVSIQTYKGNTHDVKTFSDQLDKLKTRFKLDNITIVGDGGMIKSEDIVKIKDLGYDYITSIGKPSIRKLIKDDSSVQLGLFDEELKEVIDDDIRYIIRCNPLRRDDIRTTRESKIARLQTFINAKTKYYNSHYKAKSETLINNINKKITSLKLGAFISISIDYKQGDCLVKNKQSTTDKQGNIIVKTKDTIKTKALVSIKIMIDQKARNQAEELDGCYVIKTSLVDSDKDSKEAVHKAYKTLIKVENAFKTLKTDYLEIRPLYLKTDRRIIGHVSLSMLAYNIVLKLKNYVAATGFDFKSIVRRLSAVSTVINKVNTKVVFETIPEVNEDLQGLFNNMGVKLPRMI